MIKVRLMFREPERDGRVKIPSLEEQGKHCALPALPRKGDMIRDAAGGTCWQVVKVIFAINEWITTPPIIVVVPYTDEYI